MLGVEGLELGGFLLEEMGGGLDQVGVVEVDVEGREEGFGFGVEAAAEEGCVLGGEVGVGVGLVVEGYGDDGGVEIVD